MQEICSSNPPVATGFRDPNKFQARHHRRIMFKINTEYCLQLLMPETMKLLGSNKSKMTKDKNNENVP